MTRPSAGRGARSWHPPSAGRRLSPPTQLARPGAALAATGPVNIDTENAADATTTITTTAAAAAFVGSSSAAANGVGVTGKNTFVSSGSDYTNVGVYGLAGAEDPSWALDDMESGVFGFSDASAYANGVWGVSPQGYGVYGWGDYGLSGDGATVGVEGFTENTGVGVLGVAGLPGPTLAIPANVGVMAVAMTTAGTALYVSGRTRFSRSGRTYVAKGKQYVDVPVTGGVSATSQILATATRYVSGTWVQAAVYVSSTKIRVYLNKVATTTVYFTWIVLN